MPEKYRFEDLDVDGRIIIKLTLNIWDGDLWAVVSTVMGICGLL